MVERSIYRTFPKEDLDAVAPVGTIREAKYYSIFYLIKVTVPVNDREEYPPCLSK
ncbi:MAG: hypothetical protein ACJAZ2_000443 [Glaciecola sp.]|jgi:hypothetical protein